MNTVTYAPLRHHVERRVSRQGAAVKPPVTVVVPHFARELRTRRSQRNRPDQQTVITSHFLCAAASRSAHNEYLENHRTRVKCGGGYRVLRKRVLD